VIAVVNFGIRQRLPTNAEAAPVSSRDGLAIPSHRSVKREQQFLV
jgi:hypothetical protein